MAVEIPADVLAHYESIVVTRLAPGKDLKKQTAPLIKKLAAKEVKTSDPDKLLLIGESVEALLKAVTRNTSPFYERQTFALVTLFLTIDQPDSYAAGMDLDVLDYFINVTAFTVN